MPDAAAFRADLDAATVGWAFLSMSWFLPRALLASPTTAPGPPAPTHQATILHRLDQARHSSATPALAELSGRLHDTLTARWGSVPLPYAPAFDPGS
ncbi:hypothetical protein ACFPIJ_29805 [Dactylosporangium cerinum]|uniref:Uncharacterized protein n=1 Tax=Dactylosporangium cerinum TaxID=1434730 RepID=A0ABV9W2F6_9ACTN